MLRLKDPERLPGGLDFTLLDDKGGVYLQLKVGHPAKYDRQQPY